MNTLLAQIESVIKSRPLFATLDIEVSYLSLVHLLIGRLYTSVPQDKFVQDAFNRLITEKMSKQWYKAYG